MKTINILLVSAAWLIAIVPHIVAIIISPSSGDLFLIYHHYGHWMVLAWLLIALTGAGLHWRSFWRLRWIWFTAPFVLAWLVMPGILLAMMIAAH